MPPYISFVMFARNDSYGHRGTSRLQHSIDTLLQQLNEHRLESEIVLVEWNPPSDDSQPLAEALRLPSESGAASLRIITVPSRHHARYRGHENKGMHVAAAFNVGLRRARGEFVLPKPSDVYYTDSVIARIAKGDLDQGSIYRVDRFDVDAEAVAGPVLSRQQFFEHCATHIVRHHSPIEMPPHFGIRKLHTNACGDFSLMSRALWSEVRGWAEGESVASLDVDSLALHGAAACGGREVIWREPCRVYKVVHGAITINRVRQVFRPHEEWLKSVSERTLSIERQTQLRMLLDFPKRRVEGLPGPYPSFEHNFLRRAQRWRVGKAPYYLNSADWGLALETLSDDTVCTASWEKPATAVKR